MGFAELFEIKEPDYEAMYDQMYPFCVSKCRFQRHER